VDAVSLAGFLAIGTLRGLWALEDLDAWSPSSDELEAARRRSEMPQATVQGMTGHNRPVMKYPGAGQYHLPRNLAREWIEANQQEWQALLREALESESAQTDPLPKRQHPR
jgi:hypothetical protein